jgi:hypothetical protein
LILLDCGLLIGFKDQAAKDSHKALPEPNEELRCALTCAHRWKGEGRIHATCDGRSRTVRKVLEAAWEREWPEETRRADPWIVYQPPLERDYRLPARKVAFSDNLREVVFLGFPGPLVRVPAKERTAFSASGESSTHALTYTGVPIRPFGEVPKISRPRKEAMLRCSLPERSDKIKAWTSKGEPVIFNDLKSAQLYAAIFRDLGVDCVVDMAVGSATAAIAAAMVGCAYDGICYNTAHANFATEVFERALVAMLTDAQGKPGVTSTRGETRSKGAARTAWGAPRAVWRRRRWCA